jgi:predicted amidophosphoribosyltransferase
MPQTYCPDCGHKTRYTEGVENVCCKRCGRSMSFKYSIEKIEGDPVTWLLHRAELNDSPVVNKESTNGEKQNE